MKVVCKLHERAHEDTEGCPYCDDGPVTMTVGSRYQFAPRGAPQTLDDWLSSDDLTYGYVVEGQRCSVFADGTGRYMSQTTHAGVSSYAHPHYPRSVTYFQCNSARAAKRSAAECACAYVGKTLCTNVTDE